jgi:hypothetical protein
MSDYIKPNERSVAYCKGFIDGYEEGISNNPYDGWEEHFKQQHLQYRIGYDAGVAEYCKDELDQPEENPVTYTSIDE